MRKIKTLVLVLALVLLMAIPILILGDTLSFNADDDSIDQNSIAPNDPATPNVIKDVNMAKEMQDAIDALEVKGADISELKNLKTEYAAYNSQERLAMLEDDFENAMKYKEEKERIVISFSDILKEEGFYNFNIYEFTKNHNY